MIAFYITTIFIMCAIIGMGLAFAYGVYDTYRLSAGHATCLEYKVFVPHFAMNTSSVSNAIVRCKLTEEENK